MVYFTEEQLIGLGFDAEDLTYGPLLTSVQPDHYQRTGETSYSINYDNEEKELQSIDELTKLMQAVTNACYMDGSWHF